MHFGLLINSASNSVPHHPKKRPFPVSIVDSVWIGIDIWSSHFFYSGWRCVFSLTLGSILYPISVVNHVLRHFCVTIDRFVRMGQITRIACEIGWHGIVVEEYQSS